jgi:hypothetical protein
MNLKIAKVLLLCAIVCSTIIATTATTINSRQTYALNGSQTIFTSRGELPRAALVGDPLPGDVWPQGGNWTGNQTR